MRGRKQRFHSEQSRKYDPGARARLFSVMAVMAGGSPGGRGIGLDSNMQLAPNYFVSLHPIGEAHGICLDEAK